MYNYHPYTSGHYASWRATCDVPATEHLLKAQMELWRYCSQRIWATSLRLRRSAHAARQQFLPISRRANPAFPMRPERATFTTTYLAAAGIYN